MNKTRRNAINKLSSAATELLENYNAVENRTVEDRKKFAGKFEDLRSQIETVYDEENDYYDNMPESLQGSDKGESSQSAIDALESAMEAAQEIVDLLEDDEGPIGDLDNSVVSFLDDAAA